MKLQMRTLVSLSLAAALAGCSLAPTYEPPDAPVSSAYPSGPAYKAGGARALAPAHRPPRAPRPPSPTPSAAWPRPTSAGVISSPIRCSSN